MHAEYFYSLIDRVCAGLAAGESLTAYLAGEKSDFVRFNGNRVRQAGSVEQNELTLTLIHGRRHAAFTCDLTCDADEDHNRLRAVLAQLREQCAFMPDDPYLNVASEGGDTHYDRVDAIPSGIEAAEAVVASARGMDLVGLWSGGSIYRGFANSLGQRNWHGRRSFNLDWSCYQAAPGSAHDHAVKANYAGHEWDSDRLGRKMAEVREALQMMDRPVRVLSPGRYRAYLAPAAVYELVAMLAWGGFGLKSQRTAQTPLIKMIRDDWRFDRRVALTENLAGGLAPVFTPEGFIKPERVTLVEAGGCSGALVGARSAKEYGQAVNSDTESPVALEMAAGDLVDGEVRARLGTGLYISNLWYCNFADRNHCRITGMTRFACFWIENGEIRAPIGVMRFDDSLYELFGDALEGLTRDRELLLNNGTYERRNLGQYQLPGVLVSGLTLTL